VGQGFEKRVQDANVIAPLSLLSNNKEHPSGSKKIYSFTLEEQKSIFVARQKFKRGPKDSFFLSSGFCSRPRNRMNKATRYLTIGTKA